MIFSSASNYMLKYQKAKAKLVEYGIKESDYPKFQLDSNELSYPAVYTISRYVESVIDNDTDTRNEFAIHMTDMSQYFDAAVNSKDRALHDNDFLLSGATAYFFSNDFGSAKVLCSKISLDSNHNDESPQILLINIFNFIFRNKMLSHHKSNSLFSKILNNFIVYFHGDISADVLYELLVQYRRVVYESNEPISIYYIDILFAVIIEIIKKSAWVLLPKYSDCSLKEWSGYLKKSNAIKILWPSQQLIAEKGVLAGENAIVQLPTGVGKTKSIDLVIRSAFLSQRANTVVIIAPLRALCNEITNEMNQVFADEADINQFSDVLQEDITFEVTNLSRKKIIICTPEKLSYIMYHKKDIIDDIDLFIFDEGHMFDDGDRGVLYELLVSEIREQLSSQKQLVLLSAVLSNANEILDWLLKDRGVLASSDQIKATPKSIGFASKTKDINYFSDNAYESDYFIPNSVETVQLKNFGKESAFRTFPVMTDSKDIAIYYAIRLCRNGGVAIYVNRTDSILTVIKRILDLKRRDFDMTNLLSVTNIEQANKIKNLIQEYYGEEHEYCKGALLGVFPHYADLPNGIKLAVEYAIRKNEIRFVVCTSTLAQGVNIPIKYLFMTNFNLNRRSMQVRSFQNLIGRTARSGMYTEGSIVVTDPKLFDQRNDNMHGGRHRWNDRIKMFDPNASEPCSSSILSIVQNIYIDYQVTLSGKNISEYIINNYEQPNCFSSLLEQLVLWFTDKYPDKEPNILMAKINDHQRIVDSIENHLCFVFSNFEVEKYEELSTKLCTETLAYALANDAEKSLLLRLFSAIARKIQIRASQEKIQKYSRTMIGIDQSLQIEKWIEEKNIDKISYNEEQLLDMIIIFFFETQNITVAMDQFILLTKFWILGNSFKDMTMATELPIKSIEKVCSKLISYQLSFFIGNIIDILCIDTNNNDTGSSYSKLCVLQKKVKYGVKTMTSISMCENVFNDRVIAGDIPEILGNDIESNNIITSIRNHSDEILDFVRPFPDFFYYKIKTLI
ncbi:DEAD/DEAH box helicase [Acetobacterium malicum]|uniref:DEAD/DEAH box helicase n=1 Tax=Acetobacterium malicum TaxID=52692 RepID=UPI000409F8B5|nr:DEAD/DEAH box helicase [Acetobacterium dehalogenans]